MLIDKAGHHVTSSQLSTEVHAPPKTISADNSSKEERKPNLLSISRRDHARISHQHVGANKTKLLEASTSQKIARNCTERSGLWNLPDITSMAWICGLVYKKFRNFDISEFYKKTFKMYEKWRKGVPVAAVSQNIKKTVYTGVRLSVKPLLWLRCKKSLRRNTR